MEIRATSPNHRRWPEAEVQAIASCSAKAITLKVPNSSPLEDAVARAGGWTMLLRRTPLPKWSNAPNDGTQQVKLADASVLHAKAPLISIQGALCTKLSTHLRSRQ